MTYEKNPPEGMMMEDVTGPFAIAPKAHQPLADRKDEQMRDDKAHEVLKKELGFEIEISPDGFGVVKDKNDMRWFSRYQAKLWQAALSREKRLQDIALICSQGDSK